MLCVLLLWSGSAVAQAPRVAGSGFTLDMGIGFARAHYERANFASVNENALSLSRFDVGGFVSERVAVIAGLGGAPFSAQEGIRGDDFGSSWAGVAAQVWISPRWSVELGPVITMVSREEDIESTGPGVLASVSFALARSDAHAHMLSFTWLESRVQLDRGSDDSRFGHRMVGLLFRWQYL